VDPSIFGTLFERGLDPAKRSQLGAHYTSRADIETLVEPVVMQPLRRAWDETRQTVERLLAAGTKSADGASRTVPKRRDAASAPRKARAEADAILHRFLSRLHAAKVLDPACGSGNFLFVTLQKLKDLEKDVILFAMDKGFGGYLPMVGPWQLHGIEVNPYAHDLAQTAVWIGFLQWTRANGFQIVQTPVLRSMSGNFQCRDAILNPDGSEPPWPAVDFIVGNPPFLGGKKLRRELGDGYMDRLLALWKDRVPAEADLCCYWFEKARAHIERGACKRAGLLATQGIRGGANREVLKRIKETGDIFWAVSDKDWVLDGASVHVSLIAFDARVEETRTLDGRKVSTVNANLTDAADTTRAQVLEENRGIAFMGDTKVGPFEIPDALAREWLALRNPNGKPNADVLRPWANGLEITRAPQGLWIVDFPPGMAEAEAAQYEAPFEYVKQHVKPFRAGARSGDRTGVPWWIHQRPRPEVRASCLTLPRYLATPTVSKHRLFVWLEGRVLPDHQLIVFARSDDWFFGVLHSRAHEVWALAMGTRLESRPRYTPTTCFETFPLPAATPEQRAAITEAARALDEARRNWLGDRSDRKRTLTALYNKKPQWLADAHRRLDEAVFAAYGWPPDIPDPDLLARLLEVNAARPHA
jgi:type II restriction/modification system DNA methylase subunit YeeA